MDSEHFFYVCYANESFVEPLFDYDYQKLFLELIIFYLFRITLLLITTVLLYMKCLKMSHFQKKPRRKLLEKLYPILHEEKLLETSPEFTIRPTFRSKSCYLLRCASKEIDTLNVNDMKEIADSENKSYPQQEDPDDYGPGGYMPITYKRVLGDKYQVIRKLGFGHFSTVWLCENMINKEYVAIKVCKSANIFTLVAQDEIKLLQCTKDKNPEHPGSKNIVQMLDFFNCRSVNGLHTAIAFEIMGPSLLHLIIQSDYRGIQLPGLKAILRQVLQGLVYLHDECNIIHTDIKPENILIKIKESYVHRMVNTTRKFNDLGISMPRTYVSSHCYNSQGDDEHAEDLIDEVLSRSGSYPDDYVIDLSLKRKTFDNTLQCPIWINPNIEVKLADLGNACWDDHHYSSEIQTKQYRALEVILGAGYSFPADIWSLGCVAFELATGEYLFNPKQYNYCSATADHLTLIWEVLDGIPAYITSKGINAYHYFDNGRLRHMDKHQFKIWKIEDVLVDKYQWKRVDAIPFASFIESMIEPDPQLRITAAAALQVNWLNE